jgi:hypothetical protein
MKYVPPALQVAPSGAVILIAGDAAGLTFTIVVALACSPPLSVTVSEKVRAVAVVTEGAVKVGLTAAVLDKVTAGPPVCSHR